MTETPEKRPLFRPEAVEHHARGQVGGRRLDLREAVTVWLFRGLLGVLALAVVVAFAVRVDSWTTAAATIGSDGRTATLTTDRKVETGTEVRVRIDGREVRGRVTGARDGAVEVALADLARSGGTGPALLRHRQSIAFLLLGRD
ncbi:MAG TPA: hypothetical protein VNQ77_02495 [Frankiaceae bacterium]|nr:hypothetical protein [Frankiaceae bacterium]